MLKMKIRKKKLHYIYFLVYLLNVSSKTVYHRDRDLRKFAAVNSLARVSNELFNELRRNLLLLGILLTSNCIASDSV